MPHENPGGGPRRLWPFALWLITFYCGWLALVVLGDLWPMVVAHWPIALTMTLGSYVAGSTPMGGGTVAFPVLTLLFDQPGALGRTFALAIQSVGMVSATIYLLCSRRSLDGFLLRPALVGSLLGTPLGVACVAPYVPDLSVKLLFATVWASFGLMHLVRLRDLLGGHATQPHWLTCARPIGAASGFVGGIVASITGVGIDMILYAVLALLYRADPKTSIPSSVVLMAFTSIVGIVSNIGLAALGSARHAIDPAVLPNWLAAAPVVILGAPLGALVVQRMPRAPTLVLVSLLCIAQFVWTLEHEDVAGWYLVAAILGVGVVNALLHTLYRLGRGEPVLVLRAASRTTVPEQVQQPRGTIAALAKRKDAIAAEPRNPRATG